jgi:hypothetical protein
VVKTASGSGKMKGDLHRMTHFFLLRQAPLQQRICYYLAENELAKNLTVGDSKVINPLLLAEETDRHQCGSFQYATNRKQADNMKASPKSQCYGHRHIQ